MVKLKRESELSIRLNIKLFVMKLNLSCYPQIISADCFPIFGIVVYIVTVQDNSKVGVYVLSWSRVAATILQYV